MLRKSALSLAVLVAFVGLAFGSAESDPVDITVNGEEMSLEEVLEQVANDVEQVPVPQVAPPGQCCCSFREADAPTQQFIDAEQCTSIDGTCGDDVAPCVAFAEQLAAKAGKCCCGSTETVMAIGDACEGECYEFFEEGDTPGSCIY